MSENEAPSAFSSVPARPDAWAFEGAFERSPAPTVLLDRELRIVAVSESYRHMFGLTDDQLVGRMLLERFPDRPGTTNPDLVRGSLDSVFTTGSSDVLRFLRYDVESTSQPGTFEERYWTLRSSPIISSDGEVEFAVVQPEDVSALVAERIRAAAAGSQPLVDQHAITTVLETEIERLRGITTLAEALVNADSSEDVGRTIVRDGLRMVGADGGSFAVLSGDRFRLMAFESVDESVAEEWADFTVTRGADPFSDALLSGEPVFFDNRDDFLSAYPHLRDAVVTGDHHSWAVLPLADEFRAVGAIGAIYDRPNAMSAAVRLTLLTLRDLAWKAAWRARLVEEQSTVVASVQSQLDLDVDVHDDLVISKLYRPATQTGQAGGDFFDVVPGDDGCFTFIIADIANHGSHAVGEMVRARATLQSNAVAHARPGQIASASAAALRRFGTHHTTACIASFDPSLAALSWTSAGHPYPLIRRRDGSVAVLAETHGPPLGVVGASTEYSESSVALGPGDTLVLYTDGLIERREVSITDSIDSLAAVLGSLGPGDVSTALYSRLRENGLHNDDVAILAVTLPDRH